MAIPSSDMRDTELPNIYLGTTVLNYVKEFRYLGHVITCDFSDDLDIAREIRSLYARGNALVRNSVFLSLDVKCKLFESYCYSLYGAALWSKYNQSTLYRLKVCYNSIMRKLAYVAPWQSARAMFVGLGVRSFEESMRTVTYSLKRRIEESNNPIIVALSNSDTMHRSSQRLIWDNRLFVH